MFRSYGPPASPPAPLSTQTADTASLRAVVAYLRDVTAELGDLPAPIVAVPPRPLDPCTACDDDATAGHWTALDSTVAVTWVAEGRVWDQPSCVVHAHGYVHSARRRGPVAVEVPVPATRNDKEMAA